MPHRLSPAERKRHRSAARVLDLPTVQSAVRKQLCRRVVTGEAGLLEERTPDARPGVTLELAEVQRDMDAGEERVVEGGDAVRGEEEDAAVVLDMPQEDGDHRVALHVMQ